MTPMASPTSREVPVAPHVANPPRVRMETKTDIGNWEQILYHNRHVFVAKTVGNNARGGNADDESRSEAKFADVVCIVRTADERHEGGNNFGRDHRDR